MFNLYLFTANYPYSSKETFLENEVPVLAKHFSTIHISSVSSDSFKRETPSNVKIIRSLDRRADLSSGLILRKNFFLIIKILTVEFLGCNKKYFFLKNLKRFYSQLIRAVYDADKIFSDTLKNGKKNAVFYSFWMNDWALSLAVLKEKGLIDHFVFKCGGFDIYNERHPGNYLPFRYFIYKKTSAVYSNSNFGTTYLKKLNIFPEKINTSYWGTHDHGVNVFNPNEFVLVSCSRVIPLKRVHLIVEILRNISFPVKWVHLGGGEGMEAIIPLSKTLPKNVSVEFAGELSNAEILTYYKHNNVSLFITTSETEGLPVSIQEAISFGIPVMGTNVGGVKEIANKQTGYLIDKNFDPKEVANIITSFRFGPNNSDIFRQGVRAFWMKNFEANHLYGEFAKKISERFINS